MTSAFEKCTTSLLVLVFSTGHLRVHIMKRSRSTAGVEKGVGAECSPPAAKRTGGASASGHWSMKLVASMENPDMVVQSDELTVTIKDAYPKAKHHYLVLPRDNILSLRHLNETHVPLLSQMLENGKTLEDKLKTEDGSLEFRHGYHALPSMSRLHMHVISQDFVSPCLKNKKHWNSFTTDFFVDAEDVIKMLETRGEVKFDKAKYEALLKNPLKCHICSQFLRNMPKLKAHIEKYETK